MFLEGRLKLNPVLRGKAYDINFMSKIRFGSEMLSRNPFIPTMKTPIFGSWSSWRIEWYSPSWFVIHGEKLSCHSNKHINLSTISAFVTINTCWGIACSSLLEQNKCCVTTFSNYSYQRFWVSAVQILFVGQLAPEWKCLTNSFFSWHRLRIHDW